MRREPTLIHDRRDTGRDWRMFAAILCCLGFYADSVQYSMYAKVIVSGDGNYPDRGLALAQFAPLIVRAMFLVAIAKCVLRRSRWTILWIVLSVLASVVSLIAAAMENAVRVGITVRSTGGLIDSRQLAVVEWTLHDAGRDVTWLALLVAAVVLWCRKERNTAAVHASWAILAAAWSGAAGIAVWSWNQPLYGLVSRPPWLRVPGGLGAFYTALAWSTACLLILRSRLARTSALALAAITIGTAFVEIYNWWLIHDFSIPNFRWTSILFFETFVMPVSTIGPWLIIACFARWAPMANPREDASPFPRRYCGRCGYNLHGLTTTRCPECGESFELDGRGEALM